MKNAIAILAISLLSLIVTACSGPIQKFESVKTLSDLQKWFSKELHEHFTISQLKNMKELDLISKGITSLPPAFGLLKNLEKLDLSYNKLSTLPPAIGQLKKLKWLNLRANLLEELPAIELVKNLEELDLSRNMISTLPPAIGQLKKLKWLNLKANLLEELPEAIGDLENLTHLNLTSHPRGKFQSEYNWGYNLSDGPASDRRITNINKKDLTPKGKSRFNYRIARRNDNLWRYLQYYKSRNRLTRLPKSIGKLKKLKILVLNENELRSLPESFGQLIHLRWLSLYHNRLSALPKSIGRLNDLKSLDLRQNKLSLKEKARLKRLLPNCDISY